ncbi:hypothetical protein AV530_007976 [Patagioenas fasciata monilis]|uniref:Uncharacterized protein n=1 Tax=Patagioenas fasciata monilis TaxID=372326 RepID=A0A1V4KU46_PATFA|nr:hypothetical protein AV530_007976 [Patagioenas fasciata monilis]
MAAAKGAAAEHEMLVDDEQAAPWGLSIAELSCVLSKFQVFPVEMTGMWTRSIGVCFLKIKLEDPLDIIGM